MKQKYSKKFFTKRIKICFYLCNMNSYFKLFSTFSKIGAFTIGGGFVMIPLIHREVVERHKWMDNEEFMDVLTIAQSAPGIMAINLSIFLGYKVKGVKGSIVASIGTALPSFLIILGIAMFFSAFKNNEVIENIFKGIRPAVVALIAVPLIKLSGVSKLNIYTGFIPVITVLLIVFFHISPLYLILAGGIIGVATYKFYKR
jgi:chromate transporter